MKLLKSQVLAHGVCISLKVYANEAMRCRYEGKPHPDKKWYQLMALLSEYIEELEKEKHGRDSAV